MLIASITSAISGTALAALAERYYPGHVVVLERTAGVLMVGGLALLGSGLPFVP